MSRGVGGLAVDEAVIEPCSWGWRCTSSGTLQNTCRNGVNKLTQRYEAGFDLFKDRVYSSRTSGTSEQG